MLSSFVNCGMLLAMRVRSSTKQDAGYDLLLCVMPRFELWRSVSK